MEVGVPQITQFGNRVVGEVDNTVNTGIANSRALGVAGEQSVGLSGTKTAIQIGGRTRIPDALTRTTLTEVKNVKTLSFTSPLRDFLAYSQQNGLDFVLYTRPNTVLSGPLQQAINNGLIIHRFIPGL
ncbi:putative toxin [Parapedobacter koreensis]|uniref:putative toxin n=1 Tax=Parapedobacter koreensis TaxID=332977 RepID=UPI00115FCAE8|nr:putative toxin [Parapedobacter koreensis]